MPEIVLLAGSGAVHPLEWYDEKVSPPRAGEDVEHLALSCTAHRSGKCTTASEN